MAMMGPHTISWSTQPLKLGKRGKFWPVLKLLHIKKDWTARALLPWYVLSKSDPVQMNACMAASAIKEWLRMRKQTISCGKNKQMNIGRGRDMRRKERTGNSVPINMEYPLNRCQVGIFPHLIGCVDLVMVGGRRIAKEHSRTLSRVWKRPVTLLVVDYPIVIRTGAVG